MTIRRRINSLENSVEEINKSISQLEDKSVISDGSHTFGELYEDRMKLFALFCNSHKDVSWKSKLHDDGTMFENYFICGVNTVEGTFTYHYHLDHWKEFNIPEIEKAPEYDGHTRKDIDRLKLVKPTLPVRSAN